MHISIDGYLGEQASVVSSKYSLGNSRSKDIEEILDWRSCINVLIIETVDKRGKPAGAAGQLKRRDQSGQISDSWIDRR